MPTREFSRARLEVNDRFMADLVELLIPFSVRGSQAVLAMSKSETLPGVHEDAQRYVDAGGAVHFQTWDITDASGIQRPSAGRIAQPEKTDLNTCQAFDVRVSASVPVMGPNVRMLSVLHEDGLFSVRFRLEAFDDLIEDLLAGVLRVIDRYTVAEPPREAPPFKVFIGHGRDPQWKYLHRALNDNHGILAEAYESIERAGYHTLVVVDQMVRSSAVAVVIMTGEDEVADGPLRARENVVHEVGFCQGALGLDRTIILMEEGLSEPSNIAGMTQIRFPPGALIDVEDRILDAIEQRRQAYEFSVA